MKRYYKFIINSYLKIAATLLKENGYLIIGDYDT